ncbi:MAG: hypothetical protein IJ672_08905 [Methanobrevibacter sp.]|nr:hypothetical protein [Methanobrevibacter sp.]MBR1611582.1 hypothetical protein [Methanobrevibacter sp.]
MNSRPIDLKKEEVTSINYEEKIAELNTEKNIRDSIIAKKQKELFDSKQEIIEKDIELAKKDMRIIEKEDALKKAITLLPKKMMRLDNLKNA